MSNAKIDRPNFEAMELDQLREYAALLRLSVPDNATKASLVKAINGKLESKASVRLNKDVQTLPDGYARLTIIEDPMPGASNSPVYVNANGYQCTIPRGVSVVVPKSVLEVLTNAKVKRIKNTTVDGRDKNVEFDAPSYPFIVHEVAPGDPPLTTLEKSKLRAHGPRRRFKQKFGYYPRHGQLNKAIEKGLITLDEGEELRDSELKAADKDD